jgi:Alpha-mannosidase
MRNPKLLSQTNRKLKLVMNNYEHFMFEEIAHIESADALQTKKHFRHVPDAFEYRIHSGDQWGGMDMNLWARCDFTVPDLAAGRQLYAISQIGGREELFFVNGKASGIYTWKNQAVAAEHSARLICSDAVPGENYELAFECLDRIRLSGINGFDVSSQEETPDDEADVQPGQTFGGVRICALNEDIKGFCFDMRELILIAEELPEHSFINAKARRVLDEISRRLILCPQAHTHEEMISSVRECLSLTRPFFQGQNRRIFGHVGLIGHSHLDTAWLWPINETVRKCARTISGVLDLMDSYPEYTFMMSSALHAEWMRDEYPEIFAGMRARAREGRFEFNGGVYVECDCNIPSGEMMIRQFILGQRFAKAYFGKPCDTFWLLDTFGYNANIPQIMLGCGVRYFATNKINCNEINPVTHHSFIWRGIDGSEVLAHIPSSGGHADVTNVFAAIDTLTDKTPSDKRLLAFGFGDGGGGPTRGMLEEARRVMHCDGMPETRMQTVSRFMQMLDEEDRKYLPTVDDEIYFEFHRGTLTQNHDVKWLMRKTELAYRNYEYFLVITGHEKSREADSILKTILVNQFHDILPGTCINSVYDTYRQEMKDCLRWLSSEPLNWLSQGQENAFSVYNTLPFARYDPAVLCGPIKAVSKHPVQVYKDICGRCLTAVGKMYVDAFSATRLNLEDTAEDYFIPFKWDGRTAITPYAAVRFDDYGSIDSFIDLQSQRELRNHSRQALNSLWIADDLPEKWDNWNIDSDAMERFRGVRSFQGIECVSIGPVEMRLRSRYDLDGRSSLVQDIVFYADTPRVDFHTLVYWNSVHTLLKTAFPLNLRTRNARCEIQYGHVSRPTHATLPTDEAKFEVCSHKWTDISESGFGCALLSDCKYGISVKDCVLALSLHRGGTMPDSTGDRGTHEMTYSFLPHTGGFSAKNTVHPAYMLNVPYFCVPGTPTVTGSFVRVDAPSVICEVVKPADLDPNAYIMRLYECEGGSVKAHVHLAAGQRAFECDMMETVLREIDMAESVVEMDFHAFEIKTILVEV